MRFERKFRAPWQQLDFARAWLHHVCVPDPHFPSGIISSIYFDTRTLDSYQEKVNGDYSKTKVRLRWYTPELHEKEGKIPAFFEIKMKDGAKTAKERKEERLSKEWLKKADLTDEDFRALAAENFYELGVKNPDQLFPVLEVSYQRERFICTETGARVSLDTEIRADRMNSDFLPHADPTPMGDVVIEIKDEKIKEVSWLKELYEAGFRFQTYSKYAWCLYRLLQGVPV